MKTSVGNSACWLCALLDLLSALTFPSSFSSSSGVLGRMLTSGQKRTWEGERRRYIRALESPISLRQTRELYDRDDELLPRKMKEDVRDTEMLMFMEQLMSSHPNCSQNTQRGIFSDYSLDNARLQTVFREQVKKGVQLANVLNSLFLYKHRTDLYKNLTFFALTHSLVQNDPKLKGCGIAFADPSKPLVPPAPDPVFFPFSYHSSRGATVVSDLSKVFSSFNTSWWSSQHGKNPARFTRPQATLFTNHSDVGPNARVQSRWNKTVRVSEMDGVWARPYYNCLLQAWILQFSLPFFHMHGNGTAAFRGVVMLAFDLSIIEVNQCEAVDDTPTLFAGTHRCRRESTKCVPTPGTGLRWGSYECVCQKAFYFPDRNATNRSFLGRDVELAYLDKMKNNSLSYDEDFMCLPCRNGCDICEGDEPCIVEFDVLLRGIPLGVQSFCMTIAIVVGIVIARLRKTKVMRSSVWVLLEMIILGALLLYATVIIQYFEPTATNCLLVPWFREMGFAMLYGTLLLKIYRILAEFQSRKAHRVHVRDKDLFKSLAVIVVVVLGYMSAWTAVNVDHQSTGNKLIHPAVTPNGLSYVLCRSLWWDYAIEIAEVLFLVVGVYLCYCVRSAPSDFSERRCVTGAIIYELGFSLVFYVCKHMWWMTLHPDHLFLLYFLRCQLTITFNLLMLLGPKLWYAHRPPDDDRMRTRAYSQSDVQDSSAPETMKLNVGISSNGDVDVGEISLTEMDPEDIRAELKRLYTQLQIYKTKTMRKDNPHISKRRGGRKQTHRRFSLQAFHHKHRHHHEHEHEHEMSKTPEESTNSAEAVTFPMEPSVKEEPNEGGSTGGSVGGGGGGRNPPSVSFKPSHT